jgi:hypothetical protein
MMSSQGAMGGKGGGAPDGIPPFSMSHKSVVKARVIAIADAVHCALVLRETLHELASHEAADLGAVVASFRAGKPLTASGLERRVLC